MKLLLMLVCAGACLAQNAQVYDLQASETAEGQRLFKQMNDAKNAYDDWAEKMGVKYFANGCWESWSGGAAPKLESASHFQATFDASFKHAVRRYPDGAQPSGGPCTGGGGATEAHPVIEGFSGCVFTNGRCK